MKKYVLYEERYVVDSTTYEVPDDFDMDAWVDERGGYEIPEEAENVTVNYNISSEKSEWYSLEDMEGQVIDAL